MYNLEYLVMKANRAKLHLDALNIELDRFFTKPDAITRKYYDKQSCHVCRTEFAPMPILIGMLLGELLYNLRSGLDQMAWQLALPDAKGNERTARNICFPIFQAITDKNRNSWRDIISSFPDDVAKAIEALQPYSGPLSPKDHPLWQLNALCNIDKHRIIAIHSQQGPIFVPITDPPAKIEHFYDPDAIEVSVPLKDAAKFHFEPEAPMEILFGEWESDLAIPRNRLGEIHDFVRDDVIPRFSCFISKAPESSIAMRVSSVASVYNG